MLRVLTITASLGLTAPSLPVAADIDFSQPLPGQNSQATPFRIPEGIGSGSGAIPRQWSAADNKPVPLLVLVSFSMPKDSLREFASQAGKLDAPLVLRGLVDDSMPATATRIGEFQNLSGVNLAIDPTLYARFGVSAVPTVILLLEPLSGCTSELCPVPRHVKVTGEAGLGYVLELIERSSREPGAKTAAARLRKQLESQP